MKLQLNESAITRGLENKRLAQEAVKKFYSSRRAAEIRAKALARMGSK